MITETSRAGVSRQRGLLNVILVYIIIFTSGSLRYNQSKDMYIVLGFLIVLIAWFVYSDRKISGSFLLYGIIFSGFLFALSLYTGGSLSLASVIATTMKLILVYLIISTVGARFATTFVKIVVFLAVISLLGYLSDALSLFDGLVQKLPIIPKRGYDGIFYLFRDTHHPHRNQSIFFEPGAYQGFLNAALFIIFFVDTGLGKRKQWVYIAVLVAALITTFSTTGFILFLLSLSLFLYKSEIVSFYGKLVLVVFGVVIVSVFAAQFHTTFVEKINDYLTADEYDFSYSAQNRSSDLKADIRVIKNHVFGLGQENYSKEFRLEGRIADGGSSNGVTKILAMYGIPFGLFIFGSIFWALRRLLNDYVLVTGAFVMFMLFLAGESYYINTPVTYAFIAGAFVLGHESSRERLLNEKYGHPV